MEDAHIIWVSADTGLFGIFDGHNGADCSQFIASRLRQVLDKGGCPIDELLLEQLFLHLDREFLETKLVGGSTATICIVRRATGSTYTLHVLNLGDSRALLGRRDGSLVSGGEHCTEQALTTDHKPSHPPEQQRIAQCGGFVGPGNHGPMPRLNGRLAISRSFGDSEHKETGLSAQPEQSQYKCDATDFLLLVCDGIVERNLTNPEVVRLVAQSLREQPDPAAAAAIVVNAALSSKSRDNLSCLVVTFDSQAREQHQVSASAGLASCE